MNDSDLLFEEPGARWRSVAYGPLLCVLVALLAEPQHWIGLGICGALIAGFRAVQVYAGRTHATVELTGETLRTGAEELPVARIAEVVADPTVTEEESARLLGELSDIPRGRHPIVLRLRDDTLVTAWARRHRQLSAELGALVS